VQWAVSSTVPFVQPRYATATAVVTAGETTIADLRLQAVATVRVTMTRAGGGTAGGPIAGAYIYSYDTYAPGGRYVGAPDASGVLLIQMPEGGYQLVARASDNVTVLAQGVGEIAAIDDGRVIDVLFHLVPVVIGGKVFAGDGVTPAQIESDLRGAVHHIVEPNVTGNTYAVTLASPSSQAEEGSAGRVIPPALAHVFANTTALVPVEAVFFQRLDGTSYYRWTVTIPAGESVTLMHFAVQRDPTDTAGAEAQAQALVNLSDANALLGMTAQDKARVVNFKIQ
jgi:hypothetical protein